MPGVNKLSEVVLSPCERCGQDAGEYRGVKLRLCGGCADMPQNAEMAWERDYTQATGCRSCAGEGPCARCGR